MFSNESVFQKLFSSFRTNLISGVLAIAPLAAVVWVVAWFWELVTGLRRILPSAWDPRVFLGIEDGFALAIVNNLEALILLVLIVIVIAAVGLASRLMLGKRVLKGIQRVIDRIPVLRTVYSTLEQLVETFGGTQGKKQFRKVVMVEYPRKGILTLALVTGERANHPITGEPGRYLNIFVPTTPNPTSGFFLTVPADDVTEMKMTVEEALKQIISMGIVQ